MSRHRGRLALVAAALVAAVGAVLVALVLSEPATTDAPESDSNPTTEAETAPVAPATWELSGTVCGDGRLPIFGAAVQVGTARTTTNARGEFTLEGLTDERVEAVAGARGHAMARVTVGRGDDPVIRLTPLVPFDGEVVLPTGTSAAGVIVTVRRGDVEVPVEVGADGRFSVGHLAEGPVTIRMPPFVDDEGIPWLGTSASIDTRRENERHVELTPEQGASITGTVRDPQGERIDGAVVTVKRNNHVIATTRSGADGTFATAVRKGREYWVVVDAPHEQTGWRYQRWFRGKFQGDGEPLDVRMEVGTEIAGVVHAPRGIRIAGRTIGAYRIAGSARNHICTARIEEGGQFRIRGLWDAHYELRVEGACRDDDPYVLSGAFRVKSGTLDVDVRLVRPVTFEGSVVDRDGTPWPGRKVIVHHTTAEWSGRDVTDDDGRFTIERVPPGTLRTIVIKPGRHQGSWEPGEHRADDHAAILQVDGTRE